MARIARVHDSVMSEDEAVGHRRRSQQTITHTRRAFNKPKTRPTRSADRAIASDRETLG